MPSAARVRDGFVALSLPGFGTVVRSGADQKFRYACDALLGLPPSNAAPALVLRPDGTLLLGTLAGMRAMTRDGCPAPLRNELSSEPVFALTAVGSTMFAFAGDGVWRSRDAGDSWELRSPFAGGDQITGLVLAGGTLYASRGAAILRSTDDGASFTSTPTDRALGLLAADTGLWAAARSANAVGARGYEIVRAESPAGPWRTLLSLNYFGGLAIDSKGAVWVGDEGGGLYHFDGSAFSNVGPHVYPSCLTTERERVYSCNVDLPSQPALLLGETDAPVSVLTLEQVDELVACEGVAATCAAAWVEWRRDVLLMPVLPDGGLANLDAGSHLDASAVDAAIVTGGLDAGGLDAAAGTRSKADAGCAVGGGAASSWWLALALLVRRASGRRERRQQRVVGRV